MRVLPLLLVLGCSGGEPLECELPEFEVARTLTFSLSYDRAGAEGTQTLVYIWDAPGVADAPAAANACVLADGLPAEIEVRAARLGTGFVSSYATIRVDLEGDGEGGCDLYGLRGGDLVDVPTSTGAHTIEVELDPTDEC